ncbi:MAG: beta-propeller fold lactonase family protein [Acidobacteria bacterium]|nr:beta-propeller fold lactonase family protein [Acidobacteriota bacterium]
MGAKIGASLLLAFAAWMVFSGDVRPPELTAASRAALQTPLGYPQLISIEPLPGMAGAMCEWVPTSASGRLQLIAALQQEQMEARAVATSAAEARPTTLLDREPLRVIRNKYPIYSAVALDFATNEVYLQDENLFGLKVFDRLANTPPTAAFTEPKRVVSGRKTQMDFNCALYIDPKSGDVYSVSNDIVDKIVVFPRNARGDVEPMREFETPHMTFGIGVDEATEELYLTLEHPPAVLVYRKQAEGKEAPIRVLEGPRTGLADPHGIALDTKNNLLFVGNKGQLSFGKGGQFFTPLLPQRPAGASPTEPLQWDQIGTVRRENLIPGSGEFHPPSITVYPLKASGDTAPLRVIQGPKTQLNWPAHIFVDEEHGELFVANDIGNSILVFRATDDGDVAPTRVLKGPRTGLKHPTGLFVDTKNNELWVTDMGTSSAFVFARTASGNTAPLRTIRSAPSDTPHVVIGNPGGVGYDTKREEILVPN